MIIEKCILILQLLTHVIYSATVIYPDAEEYIWMRHHRFEFAEIKHVSEWGASLLYTDQQVFNICREYRKQ